MYKSLKTMFWGFCTFMPLIRERRHTADIITIILHSTKIFTYLFYIVKLIFTTYKSIDGVMFSKDTRSHKKIQDFMMEKLLVILKNHIRFVSKWYT